MGFHSNIIKRSNKPSSASKLRTDADNSGQRPLIEEDRLRLGNHDTTLQSHADALTSHDTRISAAQSRASATLPKDGSEPMTGYPDLPSIDPTGNLKPIKKVQLDRVRSGQDLNAHATDDTLRAITALHQKTNSTDARVLAASTTAGTTAAEEAARAVGSLHQKTNSTDARVLQSHATDDTLRAVGNTALKTNAVDGRAIGAGVVARSHASTDLLGSFGPNAYTLRHLSTVNGYFIASTDNPASPRAHYHQYSDFAADGLDYTRTAMSYP